jgi:hypothetical protein
MNRSVGIVGQAVGEVFAGRLDEPPPLVRV